MSGSRNDLGLGDARLRELARALPEVAPTPEALSRLLVAARVTPPERAAKWPGILLAVAASASIAYLLSQAPKGEAPTESPWRAHAHVLGGAIDARQRSTTTGVYEERWFVSDATVDLEVTSFSAGRFVLSVPDAEVESVGAVMSAVVAQGRLVRVDLLSGSAQVLAEGRLVSLAPGQSWDRSEVNVGLPPAIQPRPAGRAQARSSGPSDEASIQPSSVEAVAQSKGVAKLRRVYRPGSDLIPKDELGAESEGDLDGAPAFIPRDAGHPEKAGIPWARPNPAIFSARPVDAEPPGSTPNEARPPEDSVVLDPAAAELRFMEGWSALKSGANEAAALIFDDVATSAGTTASLAPEAARWRSIALIRAGADGRAVISLRGFLNRWPEHEGYAEAALLLAERCRDEEEKQRWLKVAALSKDPQIRARAQALLDD